jgi:hypothetical protein
MSQPDVFSTSLSDTPVSHLSFSPAVVVGNLVLVSGQGSVEEKGKIVSDTFEGEFRRSIENVRRVLAKAGVRREGVGNPEPGWAQRLDMTGMLRTRLRFKCEPYRIRDRDGGGPPGLTRRRPRAGSQRLATLRSHLPCWHGLLRVALMLAPVVAADHVPAVSAAAPGGLPRSLTLAEPLDAFDPRKPREPVAAIVAGTEIAVLAILPSRTHYRVRYAGPAGKPVVVLCAADAVAPLLGPHGQAPRQAGNLAAAMPATMYTIRAGAHFCDQSNQQPVDVSALHFMVRFDESAKYRTQAPENQGDINKLLGFADNSGHHHRFSARFGWCWNDDRLELHAYVYNDGVRSSKFLGAIDLGTEHSCSITVTQDAYVFTLDGESATMPRKSPLPRARGSKLFPYFGGQETAPHPVRIWIREAWQ